MKFVLVKDLPTELRKEEYAIPAPTFVDVVKACNPRKPRGNQMTPNFLRELAAEVGRRYAIDPQFNALMDINVSPFKGTACNTDEAAAKVVVKMFQKSYPKIFDDYVTKMIQKRPSGTKVVYYSGTNIGSFLRAGFEQIKEKDVEVELGLRAKKVVGKPAVTDEQAGLNDTVV